MVSACLLMLTFLSASVCWSAPPSPKLIEQLKQSGRLEAIVARMADARARGLNSIRSLAPKRDGFTTRALSQNPLQPDTVEVVVILIDFSDNPASAGTAYAQVADFDHLLFSVNPDDDHYSMTEFYIDNSYGNFVVQGTVIGWYRMPERYSYYVSGQNGFGNYPYNAQKMAQDALTAADPDFDFSSIDNDHDGVVTDVFIVHAGQGAEDTGNDNDIWAHYWWLPYETEFDGVRIDAYSTEPEEGDNGGLTTMGVYAHEYGHTLGLPDLYDTDYSSWGIGNWSLMSMGSRNANGRQPAFLDIWCKSQLGFIDPVVITANEVGREIPSSYENPFGVRIWKNGEGGSQYFMMENRRKMGHDSFIAGSGLLIYHIDESIYGNSDENHPQVAIEQADGLFELEAGDNRGNSNDVWSSLTKTSFDDLSTPSSKDYSNNNTQVAVWDISAPDSVMSCNFDISYSRPLFLLQNSIVDDALYGNGDGIIDIGETVTFTVSLQNKWLDAEGVTATLSSDNPGIIFSYPSSYLGSIPGNGGTGNSSGDPIMFTIPEGFSPCIDSFFIDITSDNPLGNIRFGLRLSIGQPKFLVVDDDRGASWETAITDQLFARRLPFALHDKAVNGSPTAEQLQDYETVIWLTGDSAYHVLNPSDVIALKSYMDYGGNLLVTGQSLVRDLNDWDPTFLADYFRASYYGNQFFPGHSGVDGSPVGDGVNVRYASSTNQTESNQMTAINGSVSNFELPIGGVTGLTYDGSYKLLLLSFGFEGISSGYESAGYMGPDAFFDELLGFFYSDSGSLNPGLGSTAVDGEASQMNIVNHTPTFVWSVTDTTTNPVVEYEVVVGTGPYCSNRNSLWSSGLIAGSDTSIIYGGPTLEEGKTYYFSVRVNNGVTLSEWAAHKFRLNSIGTMDELDEPIHGVQVQTATPTLYVLKGSDAEGDNLTYDFEVYSDEQLTSMVTSTTGIAESVLYRVEWTVDLTLTEDQTFYWRCRMFDGYEYSEYTSAESFVVNGDNQPPTSFSLLLPADEATVVVLYPQLTWQTSTDNDPGDNVKYVVWYSLQESFLIHTESNPLIAPSYVLPTPVELGVTYFWKVKGVDLGGAETWSSETFSFYTPELLGCCVGVRGDINGDGQDMNIVDLTCVIEYLFGSGWCEMPCAEETDVNGDGAMADIVDLTFIVDYLFGPSTAPIPCY